MLLYEQGKWLPWEPIARYVPEFAYLKVLREWMLRGSGSGCGSTRRLHKNGKKHGASFRYAETPLSCRSSSAGKPAVLGFRSWVQALIDIVSDTQAAPGNAWM